MAPRARCRREAVAAIATLTLVALAPAATAATFAGVTGHTLVSLNVNAPVTTPSILGCDNFTGTSGVSINGRFGTSVGACTSTSWAVHSGTWRLSANRAYSSTTSPSVATQNTGSQNSTVRATLLSLNSGGRSAGLVASHDGVNTYLAAVMIDAVPDRVELRLINAGTPTTLITVLPTFVATNTLQLVRSGTTIAVVLNATTAINYTLSAAESATLGGGNRAGLFGGNSSVLFDDFVVSNP